MAQSRRVEKVSALIRREMSELLMNGLKDERLQSSLITLTEVDLSGDLQYCKIYVSVYGDDRQKEQSLEALKTATGFLKGELTRRLQMRRAPEIVFKLDRAMDKGTTVLNLLGKLEEERKIRNQINNELEDL